MDYVLERSRRKTLSLTVTEDLIVQVKAPLHLPLAEIERFLKKHEAWIQKAMQRQEKRQAQEALLTPERIAVLRKQAQEVLPPLTAKYAAQMGVEPQGIKITSAKKRFGSCSSTNHICFSWRLMLYPKAAIEYVVVHELAHILEKNHSKSFYKEVEKVLPDYKEREKMLKTEVI